MRKISRDAAEALVNGYNFSRSNTRVADRTMYLFGNEIARVRGTNLELNNCGWNSPTTKERLNAVLDLFHIPQYIFQCKGEWYIGRGTPFPCGEWFTIPLLR